MSGSIFLLQGDEQQRRLVEMREQAYNSEDLLQKLLAEYPNLLAGDQMNDEAPRRWLLVSREVPLASAEDGAGRWSVDHLFLDQEGIPTLVEVKRSSDTRIRREVVGQMLDYAANAVVYWPIEDIRKSYESQYADKDLEAEEKLSELLGPEADQDQFWQQVKTNLQAGRVRLVFVADVIPSELRRIVEFLNGQMDPAEVLAVELRQYVGQGVTTLVPRVIGRTEKAQQKKTGAAAERRQWDEKSFFQEMEAHGFTADVAAARRILSFSVKHGLGISWTGSASGSFSPVFMDEGKAIKLLYIWYTNKNAFVEVEFANLTRLPPFDDEAKRIELQQRLNSIQGVSISSRDIALRPNISLAVLRQESAVDQFLDVFGWVVQEIRHPR